MDKTRIIEKIYKCLRLSESCNANEAAAAMRQAQRLMGKYGISESDIVSARIAESSAPASEATATFWCIALAELVAEAFACRAYLVRRQQTAAQWRFIGAGYSAQVSAYTFSVLHRRLEQARQRFLDDLSAFAAQERLRQADIFAEAWLLRISRTVSRFIADPDIESAIDRYTEEHYGAVGEREHVAPHAEQGDYEAIMRGLRDAEKVRLFRPVRHARRPGRRLEACN